MSYPWPLEDADVVLQEALDIALDYLGFSGGRVPILRRNGYVRMQS
jgi:hypothetical protein